MNKYFQAVVFGRKKSIFAVAIALLIFTISFLHHRYLHAITGTFSYLLNNTASCEGLSTYIFGTEAFFLPQFT